MGNMIEEVIIPYTLKIIYKYAFYLDSCIFINTGFVNFRFYVFWWFLTFFFIIIITFKFDIKKKIIIINKILEDTK